MMDEHDRLAALTAAEDRALALLAEIERLGFVAAGRTEKAVERDIRDLAANAFGVETHWHKRIVRAGANTLATFYDNPPDLTIAEDDTVFLDLGPVFEAWEADVGQTYAVGGDPRKHALCRDLAEVFEAGRRHFAAHDDITGAELFAFVVAESERCGWRFGGEIAGHIVAEFPHARLPGVKQRNHIRPENPTRMRDPDGNGQARHWILEVHLVSPDASFGGFYERLLMRA